MKNSPVLKASEIITALEEFAPLYAKEEWDNTGLSVGDPQMSVRGVVLSLDCTQDVIDETISSGANMIVTHHPLIFSPLKLISPGEAVGRMILKAVKNDLVIYSAHTNMDRVTQGVSGMMAEKLNLTSVELLSSDRETSFGLGVIGNLPAPVEFAGFIKHVKERFGIKVVKCSRNHGERVSRVALCGGSGSSLINNAEQAGADLFITSDISYHHFFREGKTAIMDIGHFESENGVLDLMKSILNKKFPNFTVSIAKNNINPIQYY
ncbi:MAG: Nif3-like dinuclear metal center hexameric protein [Bacteroidales bacterium]|nr:Nif3-like dinuclear metal center hexameric protein [Bacteroidales bacterium]MDD2425353.1 Nif3-like dinuclear metal center hexameric protein [Bacteroidales bacterium]MDD3989233.1 Nif3-like dinuclear metal center hexameric protein [Bacteroidales bacterium]MDD4638408.1 Nif3-like dinuclear metal center hexameric protein [Bacteroidales bacterium]